MGLFDKLFGSGKLRPVVAAHPEVGPVVQSLDSRLDVAPARALFTTARGRWHLRWLVVTAVAEHYVARLAAGDRARTLDAWIEAAPDEALGYLARALYHVDAAWHARGGGRDDSVPAQARRAFQRAMTAAVPDLERAARLDEADPTAHYMMMGAAPGLHDGDDARTAVLRHHQEVTARAPDHHLAHRRLVFLVSERWYGSHAEALDGARQRSAEATDGSELPMLVVSAHEYARSYRHFFDDDPAGALAYATHADVAREIDAAYARSLGSTRHQPTDLTGYRRHEAALWFWSTGDPARCKVELEKVGDAFDDDDDPWHLPADRYRAIRKELGL